MNEENLQSVGNWELNPNSLTVKNSQSETIVNLPNHTAVWQHKNTGDVVCICDWGIGGDVDIWHIDNTFIQTANGWLKKLKLQKDSVEYTYGELVERTDSVKHAIEITENYLQNE